MSVYKYGSKVVVIILFLSKYEPNPILFSL